MVTISVNQSKIKFKNTARQIDSGQWGDKNLEIHFMWPNFILFPSFEFMSEGWLIYDQELSES